MSETQQVLDIAFKQAEEKKKEEEKKNLLELTKSAIALQREDKDAQWEAFQTYDWKKLPPPLMAKLMSNINMNQGKSAYDYPTCLMLALEAYRYNLDVFRKEVYPVSGGVGFTLEGLRKVVESQGHKLGTPTFERKQRPWPKNKVIMYKDWDTNRQVEFKLEEDHGLVCRMTIDDKEQEYECWLTEWMVPTSSHWRERWNHMLQVRAESKCISFGTGVGVSDDLADDNGERPAVKTIVEPKEPKQVPTGIKAPEPFAGRMEK